MNLLELIKIKLPSILNTFDINKCYAFYENDVLYLIIKRKKQLSIREWKYFEDIIKINCQVDSLHIISCDEIKEELKMILMSKSITILKGDI